MRRGAGDGAAQVAKAADEAGVLAEARDRLLLCELEAREVFLQFAREEVLALAANLAEGGDVLEVEGGDAGSHADALEGSIEGSLAALELTTAIRLI